MNEKSVNVNVKMREYEQIKGECEYKKSVNMNIQSVNDRKKP